MSDTALGEFIKGYLFDRRLTVNDLAKQMGVPHTTVARWVRGDTEPSIRHLVKLSIATASDLCNLVYLVAPDAPRQRVLTPSAAEIAQRIENLPADRRDLAYTVLRGIAFEQSKKTVKKK